jgi:hypothetical protein
MFGLSRETLLLLCTTLIAVVIFSLCVVIEMKSRCPMPATGLVWHQRSRRIAPACESSLGARNAKAKDGFQTNVRIA